ncbi:MAG TPA: PASTA domain-containing protein [Streptosporangiaceae bacterium]|nr:PASTA domain-containing protein [Streptosporangiaceae bacterium]
MPETMREEGKTRHGEQDMSGRTMLVLGGIMTVGVVAVLGMTTLVRGMSDASPQVPARPAAVSTEDAGPAETVRRGAITPHVAVPPTQGLDQRTARGRLRATRLVVAGVLRIPSAQPAGDVVRTYPAAGTGLPAGGRVTLCVSTGVPAAAQVSVPYLRGLTAEQARQAAAGLGLSVVVTGRGGAVREQTPAPGSTIPRGSEIAVALRT